MSLICILERINCGCFGTFWSYKAIAINTSSILLYFEITKSFLILNMVYLNKPDINIKSKMAINNLHTERNKVSFCVYFDFLNYNQPLLLSEPLFYDTLDWQFHLFHSSCFSNNHGIGINVTFKKVTFNFSPVVWRGYCVMVLSIRFFDGTVFWVGK